MFQLQFYSSSQLVFFHSTTNCCICLFVRENSIKFLIGLHMWQQGISHLTAVHPSFSGRDIARRCENMAESCPAQSTCPSPSGSGLQRRLSPHQPTQTHLLGACFVSTTRATKNGSPGAIQVGGVLVGGPVEGFVPACAVCLSTRPSVWNFINILLLFSRSSPECCCVLFLNLLKAGRIAEEVIRSGDLKCEKALRFGQHTLGVSPAGSAKVIMSPTY